MNRARLWVCRRLLLSAAITIVVSGSIGPLLPAAGQSAVPDYINLEFETVPNVLLVDIPSQTAYPGTGVVGTVAVHNPLHSLYLSLHVAASEGGLIAPHSSSDAVWDGFHIIPPGATVEYLADFRTTDQWARVESDLLDREAVAVNLFVHAVSLIPGVAASSSSEIIQAIGDVAQLKELMQAFIDLGEAEELLRDPVNWRTPSRVIKLADGMKEFLDSSAGRSFVISFCQRLGRTVDDNLLDRVFTWVGILSKAKIAADGLVYVGISIWSGQFTNRYLLSPIATSAPTRPFPPRLIYPLGTNTPRSPQFEWSESPGTALYTLQVSANPDFAPRIIDVTTVDNSYHTTFSLAANTTFYWRVYASNAAGASEANVGTFTTGRIEYPPAPPASCVDRAHFTDQESYVDDTDVDPGQAMDKWWRVQNSGSCDWDGYTLVFDSGEQMSGPGVVIIPHTPPQSTVVIHVPMTAPTTPGSHKGVWRVVSPNGAWVDGGKLWMQIDVRGTYQSEGIEYVGAEYPDYVTPGQRFTPAVTIKVTEGRLLDKYSRGDLLRNVGESTYGAWPIIELTHNVNTGEQYTFHFYENDPITAPDTPGTYESKWQVWQAGSYVGPVITIRFTVYIDNNHPSKPILLEPSNWWASGGTTNPPLLRAQEQGDPDGDPITHYYFEVTGATNWNSGWITSNQVTPGALSPGNYQWRAKVRDSGGAESYFSETRNFTMDSQQLTIAPLEFVPGSPSDSEEVRVYTCVNGFGGIGLGLKIEANTATDCSANGEWQWIHHLGAFCYDHGNTSTWPNWGTREQPDGNHLVRATGFHNDETIVTEACYQLGYRRPSDIIPISPLEGTWWNTRQITFRWEPSLRTDNYHLFIGTNPDPTQSPIVDTILSGGATEYAYAFSQDYETLYWKLVATNVEGSVEMEPRRFAIDRTPAVSSVAELDPIQYEPNFSVSWQGTDDRSGIEWYDLQYRDGPRGEWTDWLTGVDLTVKMFNGQPGHNYCFRARALDNAGNLEAYPGGNGDTCAAVDVTAAPQTPWWNTSYASKRNVQILNNHTSPLLVGYPVHLHFDASTSPTAAELYASSTSANKGDDVRVVYGNTTELNRWLQNFSASAIDIWFDTQLAIGGLADDQDSHQLYYGNPSATNPPDDIGTIFHQPLDGNTMALWRFLEGSGTTLHDETAYANNGSFVGSPSWGLDGKFGPYLSFPQTNDVYIDCGNKSSLNVTSVTVEGWINFRGYSQNYNIVRRAESQNEKFNSDNDGDKIRMNFYGQNGSSSWLLGSSQFPLQQWHHFAFTYDQNTSTVRFYQDGSLTKTWVNPGGLNGPLNSNTAHLKIGGAPVYLQQIRISNVARTDFSYGRYGQTTIEPSVAAGAAQAPPGSGSPDLVLQGLNAYPASSGLEGGMIVQAVLSNDGDRATENGFFTDLYSDHLPTGAGDYSGSVHFWIANPIQPGAVVTVTTLLTDTQPLLSATRLAGSIVESSTTLYGQTDSSGSVTEPDDQNNISQGAEVCVASDDLYEPDNSPAEAQSILGLQTHNINTSTDEDWVTVSAEAGQTYALATSNLGLGADTCLYLYDTDGATLLATNDDYGGTLASRIVWDCAATGTYYAAVKHWNPNVSGCGTTYDLSFGEQHTVFLPLALKRAESGLAGVAGVEPATPTATPMLVELPTPTPVLTPTATDTATLSPAPTITATVLVTSTATPMPSSSPTEEQEPEPEPTGTSPPTPTEAAVPTPMEVPTPTIAEEEEPRA